MKTPALPSGHRFDAPWSLTLIVITILGCLVLFCLVLLCLALLSGPLASARESGLRWLVIAICLVVPTTSALFAVRGYQLEGRNLLVTRPLWSTRVPLDGLCGAAVDPQAMRASIRLWGNRGLFSFTGWYRNRRLGTFRAFATNPSHSVVLTFPDRKVVVTPGDPEAFVRSLESRHG